MLPSIASLFDRALETNQLQSVEGRLEVGEIYLFDISIFKGASTVTISPEILGLSAEQVSTLRNNGMSMNSIKIFNNLTKAAGALENYRAKNIYPLLINYDRFRFCHERRLNEVMVAIGELKQKHVELKQMLADSYEEGFLDFQTRLVEIMHSIGLSQEDVDRHMPTFISRFPPLQQVLDNFRVCVSGGLTRFPSMAENTAKNELLQMWQESINGAMQSAIISTRQETLTKLTSFLETVKDADIANSSVKLRSELDAVKQRMATLLDYDTALASLALQVTVVDNSLLNADNDSLRAELNHLQSLITKAESIATTEAGSNAQAGYMLI